jgi:hypothetical protein
MRRYGKSLSLETPSDNNTCPGGISREAVTFDVIDVFILFRRTTFIA